MMTSPASRLAMTNRRRGHHKVRRLKRVAMPKKAKAKFTTSIRNIVRVALKRKLIRYGDGPLVGALAPKRIANKGATSPAAFPKGR